MLEAGDTAVHICHSKDQLHRRVAELLHLTLTLAQSGQPVTYDIDSARQALLPWRPAFLSMFTQDRNAALQQETSGLINLAVDGTALGCRLKTTTAGDWQSMLCTALQISQQDLPFSLLTYLTFPRSASKT